MNARVGDLKRILEEEREALLSSGVESQPADGCALAARTLALYDRIIVAAIDAVGVPPTVQPVALGSYGRGDFCPYSDLDLMLLVDDPDAKVEPLLYALWDLGLQLGHAVRTVDEAAELGRQDHTILSSLLESRALRPGPQLGALEARLNALFAEPGQTTAFVEAKMQEARARRQRYGETIYMLEPNVKESPGGLRELHLVRWVGKSRFKAATPRELLMKGYLSEREARALERAESFMLWTRWHMHRLSGRRQDLLRFDLQERLAELLTEAESKRVRTERFMRAFYFHAQALQQHANSIAERGGRHRRRDRSQTGYRPAPGGFREWRGTLTVGSRDQFERDPASLVRIFRVAQDQALPIYSYTKALIREASQRIDAEYRRRADVMSELFWLLEDPKADGSILEEFHELGVLRGLIPEFRRVTSRWQHSLYHVYTVDIHSLVVLQNLKRLRRGDYAEEVPGLSRWMEELLRPHVLYFAGLLHDVGKGWPRGDHSIRGEKVARAVGARIEASGLADWSHRETEDLAWLVRDHLLMSDLSQRRDTADPELLRDFAERCQTLERLRMLHMLTFADMRGTSPKVWTAWKRSLLEQLYSNTQVLLTGSEGPEDRLARRRARLTAEIEAEASRRPELGVSAVDVREFASLMPPRYVLGFTPNRMVRHVEMWRDVSRLGGLAFHVSHLRRDKSSRLTIVCPDRPGLLALLAGVLTANHLQIVSANIFSIDTEIEPPSRGMATEQRQGYELLAQGPSHRADQLALDVIRVTNEQGELCDDVAVWRQVRRDLQSVLFEGRDVESIFEERRPPPGLPPRSVPSVRFEVVFSNEENSKETIIDVWGPDYRGVLYRMARAFTESGLTISLAKISTQGGRVADGFYVRDTETGGKIVDPKRQTAIRNAVARAFEASAERPRPLNELLG